MPYSSGFFILQQVPHVISLQIRYQLILSGLGITVLLSLLTASGFSGIFGLLVFVAVLMYLTGDNSAEVQAAQDELENLETAYRRALLTSGFYTNEPLAGST